MTNTEIEREKGKLKMAKVMDGLETKKLFFHLKHLLCEASLMKFHPWVISGKKVNEKICSKK